MSNGDWRKAHVHADDITPEHRQLNKALGELYRQVYPRDDWTNTWDRPAFTEAPFRAARRHPAGRAFTGLVDGLAGRKGFDELVPETPPYQHVGFPGIDPTALSPEQRRVYDAATAKISPRLRALAVLSDPSQFLGLDENEILESAYATGRIDKPPEQLSPSVQNIGGGLSVVISGDPTNPTAAWLYPPTEQFGLFAKIGDDGKEIKKVVDFAAEEAPTRLFDLFQEGFRKSEQPKTVVPGELKYFRYEPLPEEQPGVYKFMAANTSDPEFNKLLSWMADVQGEEMASLDPDKLYVAEFGDGRSETYVAGADRKGIKLSKLLNAGATVREQAKEATGRSDETVIYYKPQADGSIEAVDGVPNIRTIFVGNREERQSLIDKGWIELKPGGETFGPGKVRAAAAKTRASLEEKAADRARMEMHTLEDLRTSSTDMLNTLKDWKKEGKDLAGLLPWLSREYVPYISGVSEAAGNRLTSWLTGASIAEQSAIKAQMQALIAASVAIFTGERGSRISDRELEIANEASGYMETARGSAEGIRGATAWLLGATLVQQDRIRETGRLRPRYRLFVGDHGATEKDRQRETDDAARELAALGLDVDQVTKVLRAMRFQRMRLQGHKYPEAGTRADPLLNPNMSEQMREKNTSDSPARI